MLSAPLAPEAVVWCSGVFDLLATTLILTCVLIARRYEDHPAVATRIQFVTVGIGALASKETAAIAAVLVLVDAWARDAISRKLVTDTGILVFIAGIFSLVRLVSAFGLTTPPFSKYVLQRAVFGSFGTLAVPWHVDVTHRLPWLPILSVVIVVYLLTLFFLRSGSKRRIGLAIAAAAWIVLPLIPISVPVRGWLGGARCRDRFRRRWKKLSQAFVLCSSRGTHCHHRMRNRASSAALERGRSPQRHGRSFSSWPADERLSGSDSEQPARLGEGCVRISEWRR